MSSACDTDAACQAIKATVMKKAGFGASRGARLHRSLQVTSCLVTRLHNFPGLESFRPKRYMFMVPPGGLPACELPPTLLPCASAAVLASAKAAVERNGFHLHDRFPADARAPRNQVRLPAHIPASIARPGCATERANARGQCSKLPGRATAKPGDENIHSESALRSALSQEGVGDRHERWRRTRRGSVGRARLSQGQVSMREQRRADGWCLNAFARTSAGSTWSAEALG
jgi:hypothetical protein